MANTFLQVFLHIVFAVKNRESLINPQWIPHVHRYIAGVINGRGHQAIAVGGTNNHVHVLLSLSSNETIADLVREVKTSSHRYIESKHAAFFDFRWQTGYACISVSPSNLDSVARYVRHQMEHHHHITMRQEIAGMLDRAGVEYDERYLFEDIL